MNNGLKYGVYFGVVGILIALIQAFVFPTSLISTPAVIISFVLPVIFMVLAARTEKAQNDGFLSFGEAFVAAMVCGAVGGLITTMFQYVLVNFIKPDLLTMMAEQAADAAVGMATKIGEMAGEAIPQDQLDKMRAEAIAEGSDMSFGKSIFGWLFSLVFTAIIAVIVAAIIKRNPSA